MRTNWVVIGFVSVLAGLPLAAPANTVVAVVNARILTMAAAGEVPKGTILIRDGKIVGVGARVEIPRGAARIDAAGDTVTPGLMAADTTLGLTEVSSAAATDDAATRSPIVSAAFDVRYGLNPDSVNLPIARLGGITSAVAMPLLGRSGAGRVRLFAGQAAVIKLTNAQNVLFRPQAGMVAEFGEAGARESGGGRGAEMVEFIDDLEAARAYAHDPLAFKDGAPRDLDLSRADLAALGPVVTGNMPVIADAHRASDIRALIAVCRREKIRLILVGAEEGWEVAQDIAAARVPVILNPDADLPTNFERLGATMRNAALLHAAGVEIALTTDDPSHLVSELRYEAGIAVAHGLPYAAALEAITVNPARMFGIDGEVGSLEAGKSADLVIWNGDPLEPLTQPIAVFVNGIRQPLRTRQLDLARRYLAAGR